MSKDTRRFQHLLTSDTSRNINPAVAASMIATDPPAHTRLRRLAAQGFTTATVTKIRPHIQQISDDLLDTMASAGGAADLISAFAGPLPVTAISELLGIPQPDRDAVRALSNATFSAGDPTIRDQASHDITAYMTALIAAKRIGPDDSLLSGLIAARDTADRLTEDELLSLAVLLLVAGHETTTSLISNAVLALLQRPTQLAALRQNPSLIPAAIDEFLRYDSPVNIAGIRFTAQPVTIDDVTIPAEQVVLISLAAANRDPARYSDPETLDLHRDASTHLGFGHGNHYCLGARLARAETEIALTTLLTRLPDLRLDTDPATLQWRHTRLIRSLQQLPVRW